jgi:hypothetical protein
MRLRCRSVVVLQRWWRWSVCMKHRLIFLSSLRTSLHALGGGKILMAERQTLDDLDIDRSETSSQLLLETKCDPAVASGTGPRILLKAVKYDMMCNRRLVPKWVNHQSNEWAQGVDGGNACSACDGAGITVTRWCCRKGSAVQHARVCPQPCNHNRDPASGSRRKNRHAAFFPDRIRFIYPRMTRMISMSWAFSDVACRSFAPGTQTARRARVPDARAGCCDADCRALLHVECEGEVQQQRATRLLHHFVALLCFVF